MCYLNFRKNLIYLEQKQNDNTIMHNIVQIINDDQLKKNLPGDLMLIRIHLVEDIFQIQ